MAKKKKAVQDNYSTLYDEDGFFIDASLFDNNINVYSNQNVNNIPYSENPIIENNAEDINDFRANYQKKSKEFSDNFDEYHQKNTYDEIVKTTYGYTENRYVQDEIYVEDNSFEELTDYEREEIRRKKKIKSIIIYSLFIYFIFLLIGICNTNLIDGNAQIIDKNIKAQRVVYNEVYKNVISLNENPVFGGEIELDELEETQRYNDKKVLYEEYSLKYASYITEYEKKKNNEKISANKTMYEDYITLLKSQKIVYDLAVSYYSAMDGGVSTQNLDLEKMKENLLVADRTYVITYANKMQAFNDKAVDLKLK